MNTVAELDRLIGELDAMTERAGIDDAISRVLASPDRATEVTRLRDHADVVRFRDELIAGLVRLDTVNRLLSLVAQVIEVASPGRGAAG